MEHQDEAGHPERQQHREPDRLERLRQHGAAEQRETGPQEHGGKGTGGPGTDPDVQERKGPIVLRADPGPTGCRSREVV